jgi:hypothetical protein
MNAGQPLPRDARPDEGFARGMLLLIIRVHFGGEPLISLGTPHPNFSSERLLIRDL